MDGTSEIPSTRNAKFRWLPELDRLLVVGAKHGRAAKRDTIDKILTLVPQLTRGDCWRRIRHLRRNRELTALGDAAKESHTSQQSEVAKRQPMRRWTASEDDKLMDWAGYETVAVIAKRLNRSERAVRFRLGSLSVSAKVTDGWSLRSLQKTLRVSPATLRRYISSGALRVKDPRISAASVAACFEEVRKLLDPAVVQMTAAALARRDDGFSAERTAELLGISVPEVQQSVCRGRLKVVNTFVTDRSFQDFCKEHGQEFNLNLMDPAMRKWLIKEYGVPAPSDGSKQAVCRAKKHALVVRTCRCGRNVAGNAYFRHAKVCQAAQGSVTAPRSQAA
jgi:hypothetical protein